MKHNSVVILFAALGVIILGAVVILLWLPQHNGSTLSTDQSGFKIGFGSDTVRAKILDIVEEGEITLGEITQDYQLLLVKILEGPYKGQLVEIDYGKRQIRPVGLRLEVGDEILITTSQVDGEAISAFFTDFVRSGPLIWLLGTFIVFSIIVSGWKGVRSLIGMAFSLLVITTYIIPNILLGKDPLIISISGSFVLLAVTLYFTYGWTYKTHAAVLGTFIALIFTGFLAIYFVDFTRLTGFGSEDALFLVQQSQTQINLRGLVLGGMLIGALGVLDDLVITQASAVMELFTADPTQKWWLLMRRAMRIGQDHVAATVNTLVLAYAGAALPTMLLFSLSGESMAYLVNLEFVTEEIVRTLVGSLGLIAAVPITTALAIGLVYNKYKLGRIGEYLGPLTGTTDSHHNH